MSIYVIENGKKVKVENIETVSKKKRPVETKAQKNKRLWDEIKGMFNNNGARI